MFNKKVYSLQFTVYSIMLILVTGSYAKEEAVPESDQQIGDFSLAGYGDRGVKAWDLAGKSADIFMDSVKLEDITGNLYAKEGDVRLTAEKGDFNKASGNVHLEQNVVIDTTSGAKLTTNSLDWDRKNQLVTTEEKVNIKKDNILTVATGAVGEPNLKKVMLQKDVKVDIDPTQDAKNGQALAGKNKIVITCDGPLEVDYEKNIAVFKNNVLVDTNDNLIYSDIMHIYFVASEENKGAVSKDSDNDDGRPKDTFGAMGSKIDRIVASGNVKIVRGENTSYSEEAVYSASDKRIVLSGKPKLVMYSTEDFNASFGN